MAETKTSKGKDRGEDEEEEYDFPVPDFDEEAYREKEINQAYMTFITFGVGILTGVLARVAQLTLPGSWWIGFLPIAVALASMRSMFDALGYGEYADGFKALAGQAFLLFFTSFAVWVLVSNAPSPLA